MKIDEDSVHKTWSTVGDRRPDTVLVDNGKFYDLYHFT